MLGETQPVLNKKLSVTDTIFPILQIPEDVVIEATSLDQNVAEFG